MKHAIVFALGLTLTPALARAQDASDPRAAYQEAMVLLNTRQPEKAAPRLAELSTQEGAIGEAAKYGYAKALYRMGFLHAALARYEELLAAGPSSRYYAKSLEWCLFIGRKLEDDVAVSRVLAAHTSAGFPDAYKDEFAFELARYHFSRALVAARASRTPEVAPPPETEKDDGISFEDDLFGEAAPAPAPEPAPKPKARRGRRGRRGRRQAPPPAPKREEDGLSFGEDLFGEEPPAEAPKAAETAAPAGGISPEQHRSEARRLVLRVDPASPFGARAKFLEALLLVQDKRENDALNALKAVVDLTAEGPEDESDWARRARARLRELAFFQLARLHFGAKQPSFSIFYYRKVDRDSLQWLDALYEEAWAEYRLGSYERALGNLLTVDAPFFEDAYYPESLILKAVIYYENCRYTEAGEIIETFLARYEPVFEALEQMAAQSRSPEDWYSTLDGLEAEASDTKKKQLARVLSLALTDPELERLRTSIREVEGERARLDEALGRPPMASAPSMKSLVGELEAKLAELRREAGAAVERKLRFEAQAVKTLVAQALRVKVETARAEETRLQASLSRRTQRPKRGGREVREYTDDQHVVWPFEGEYWRDELGTYELTLARTCL